MTDDTSWADDEDYEDDPKGTAPGLAVTTLAGAVTGLAGYAMAGPAGAVVANTGTPYLAIVFDKIVNALSNDRSRRADKMLETAAETAGLTAHQLAERAGESEETRFLTEKAVQAAGDTIWPAGVRAIGRAYAAGLLAKEKPVLDVRLRLLGIMEDLDELHVRLLDLLVRNEPDFTQQQVVAVPHRIPSYMNRYFGGDGPDNPIDWSVGRRVWRAEVICALMPEIEQVLPNLLGELRENGLINENDIVPDAIKRLSEDLAQQVNQQAGKMDNGKRMKPITLHQSNIQLPEPTWSPTELGEKILGFYAEAGAEDGQDQG